MKYKMCVTSCQCWLQLLPSVFAVYDVHRNCCRIECRCMPILASWMIRSKTSVSVVILSLTCAGYFEHAITNSETCAETISLVSHLVFTKRCMEQENREQANPCLLNTDAPLPATRQREDAFSSSMERKQGREDINT